MSNFDTAALAFRIETSIRSREDLETDTTYQYIESEINKMVGAQSHLPINDRLNALHEDERWMQLCDDSFDMCRHREVTFTTSEGSFQSPSTDLSVDIHKNWLYVRSASMWQEGGRFVADTIAEVQEGQLQMGGLTIEAKRGPQEGVFACAHRTEYMKDAPNITTGMIGCGVYGYDDDVFVGVLPSTVEWMQDEFIPSLELREARVIDLSTMTRFNQGDAFFTDHMGIFHPDTPVGEVEKPMFNDALKGLVKKLDAADDE